MMSMMRFGTLLPLLTTLLAAACEQPGTTSRAGDLATTFDTVSGVVHVTNIGTPAEWRLVPVVSIGPKTIGRG